MSVLFIPERGDITEAGRQTVPAKRLEPCARAFLPRLDEASIGAFPAEAPAPANGRILLVDDNDSVRETLADLLESEGFEAVQASDAAQAMAQIRGNPRFDVLVTDLSMPGADGITLIHQARQVQHALPAILLTGYAEQVTSVAVVAGGNFHVLRKPVERDRLVGQILFLMQRPHTD